MAMAAELNNECQTLFWGENGKKAQIDVILAFQGSTYNFLFGGVDPKRIFGATQTQEKILLDLLGGPGDTSPEKFEKIVFRIG